jgi:general secretion pathway protein G
MARMGPRAHHGFTLPELMLGTVLVAILLGLAASAYTRYVNRAKVAVAVADIGRIKLTIDAYRLRNNDQLPASLGDIGMAQLVDPWGTPYQYLSFAGLNGKGAMRKDKGLVPINSEFDLYSMGADKQTMAPLTAKVSQDDVVMANDGAFLGLASDY